jgi:hypothetical protein
MPSYFTIPLGLIAGFLVGVVVNLLVDYLPAARLYRLAKASPFVSESGLPPPARPLPRLKNGHIAPLYLWSGLMARLIGRHHFDPVRWRRRLTVEIGLALAYAWIGTFYATQTPLPFLLFYAPALTLIAVIDIEYRWIIPMTLWPVIIAACLDSLLTDRVPLESVARGGLYGLGIMFVIYLFSFVFKRLTELAGGRIGRTVLGLGDVYLAGVGGILVGWPYIGFALLMAVLFGGAGALLLIGSKLARAGRYRRFSAIPYGPYLAIGIGLMVYIPWIMGTFFWHLLRLG